MSAVREATPAPRSESVASNFARRESDRPTGHWATVAALAAAMDRYAARGSK